jgi:glycosyltransferase involved in cell wall biosynthesis
MEFVQAVAEKLSLSQHVHFLGFVPRHELIALYRGAFALTYVSFFGPENLPPLEAFACECPVIASDVPGSKEQFDDAALTVKSYHPEEIAQAVKKLIDDPDLRKSFIEKGKKRAMHYTSSHYIQDIFKMLNEFEPVRRNWR